MVKLIFLCARRAGLSHAEYAAHLLERHAPLALRHHASLRRYVLNVVDGDDAIDSLNALSYDALADFENCNYDSAEGERIVTEDHARFLGGAAGYLTRERVVRADPPAAAAGARSPSVKWICALRRSARLSAEDFASRLETEVVPDILAGQPLVASLVIDRVERRLYDAGEAWDAFLETRFADASHAPPGPFDSFDCAASLRGRVQRLTDATAVWRVAEYVERA
ncbi:MAG: hypothetical protein WEF50_13180 [Myxococcota bacterium]